VIAILPFERIFAPLVVRRPRVVGNRTKARFIVDAILQECVLAVCSDISPPANFLRTNDVWYHVGGFLQLMEKVRRTRGEISKIA
jgi:hypothetical protein